MLRSVCCGCHGSAGELSSWSDGAVLTERQPQKRFSNCDIQAGLLRFQDGKTPIDVGKLMAMAEESQQLEQKAKLKAA